MQFIEFKNGLVPTFSGKAFSEVADRVLESSRCLIANNGTIRYCPASVVEETKRKSREK